MTVKALYSSSPTSTHVFDWYLFLCVQTGSQKSWFVSRIIIFPDAHSDNYWNWTICCFQVMVLACLLKRVVCFFWQTLFKKNSIRYPKKVSWLFPNCLTSLFYPLAWVKCLFQQLYDFCSISRGRKLRMERRKNRRHALQFWMVSSDFLSLSCFLFILLWLDIMLISGIWMKLWSLYYTSISFGLH